MLASPVLETKLFVPRLRRGAVARPRLSERLRLGSEARLTLISAPAGFGKTTVLAEWLSTRATSDRSVAWLSLEEDDQHPASFWTYVITALGRVVVCGERVMMVSARSTMSPSSCSGVTASMSPRA